MCDENARRRVPQIFLLPRNYALRREVFRNLGGQGFKSQCFAIKEEGNNDCYLK
jgi:hypothetical protein